jgi:hypothetical protein
MGENERTVWAREHATWRASVLTETEFLAYGSSQRVFDVLLAALGAEVETLLVVDVVSHLLVVIVVEVFENVLDFLQVVAIVVKFLADRIQRGVDFDANDVAKFREGVDRSFTAIATVVNHLARPRNPR